MVKEIICTVCPNGCHITVEGEGDKIVSVKGFTCPRGEKYGRQEFTHPVRTLTTTVKAEGDEDTLLPVRSDSPVPRELQPDCMEVIRRTRVKAPVKRYDVIIENICGSGCNIVATGELD